MRIIIFGQKWFGAEVLQRAAILGQVVGVVAPGPGDHLYDLAANRGFPILDLHQPNTWPPTDLGLSAHCHEYLASAALAACTRGVVGYHPSLLPAYPGKNAIAEAIAAGETQTGGSLFELDAGWDSGPILKQEPCAILPGETARGLWQRALAPLGLRMIEEYLLGV